MVLLALDKGGDRIVTSDALKKRTEKMIESSDFDWTEEEKNILHTAAQIPNVWGKVVSAMYSAKASQKAARAADRQANWMLGLTVALAVFAAVEAFATAVDAGLITFCP